MFPKRRIALGVSKRASNCKVSEILMLKYSLFLKFASLLTIEAGDMCMQNLFLALNMQS